MHTSFPYSRRGGKTNLVTRRSPLHQSRSCRRKNGEIRRPTETGTCNGTTKLHALYDEYFKSLEKVKEKFEKNKLI